MKKITLLLFAFSITFSMITSAWASQTATKARFQKIYEATKKVDECSARTNISPLTFGEKNQQISILTFANLGSIMIGNDSKSYKLSVNTGTLQSYSNGKWESFTYVINAKKFLAELKSMHEFVNQALVVAQKNGKNKHVEQVTCASKIIEFTQAEHQINKNIAQK